jgi:hypothetical protein
MLIMTPLPLADGARLLGIHPKTLCRWLKQAQISLVPHPADARIKGIREQDLQQLAQLHGRPCSSGALADTAPARFIPSEGQGQDREEGPVSPDSSSTTLAELMQKLASLETKVATLQEQFAQLALALVQERERVVEQRLAALESLVPQSLIRPMPNQAAPPVEPVQALVPLAPRALSAAEQAARSRMPPLVEYNGQGCYVMVSSLEGELHLEPDSPAWFDWLATISSFRFIGRGGRFSAYRTSDGKQHTRSWAVRRWVHGHDFWHYLGVTDNLTLASLEQAAAALQARVDAL